MKTIFLSIVALILTACANNSDNKFSNLNSFTAMNSENTVVCQAYVIRGLNLKDEGSYKSSDFKIHITRNPTFNSPQVSLGWWGRLDVMGWMKFYGKYEDGKTLEHILFLDEANNAKMVKYTKSNDVKFTTNKITGYSIEISAACPV